MVRNHNVLTTIVNFLEDVERNIMSALLDDDLVSVLTMVKGFEVLSAAVGGPNNKNRLVLTRTNVISMMNRLFANLRYAAAHDVDPVQQAFKAFLRASVMRLLADLVQTPLEPLVAKRIVDTIDWQLMLGSWGQVNFSKRPIYSEFA